MKINFKNGILVTAIFGIVLQFIPELKSIGLLMLFIVLPILLIYITLNSRKEILQSGKKLASAFLISISVTTVSIVIYTLMKILRLPGNSEMMIITAALSVLSIVVGTIYIWLNPNIIGAELALIFLPVIMIVWDIIPLNTPPQLKEHYTELMTAHYWNQATAFKNVVSDCEATKAIENLEDQLITSSGGFDENGRLVGFYNTKLTDIYRQQASELVATLAPSYSNEQMIEKSTYVGELIICLTQLRNEVIIKNCL
ncbi:MULTISPECIES: hypothetical protein [Reichenbachiella]|uniref:Uncharacterized protein n=1 Tax=Reichenbachiella agariperforans TaxID=156994 RepID=A0A1M6WG65_REIAG|nr:MULTISPECIES: hypothetical protein [Reichenbachiella]RJE72660.1 hypothetical protein BGP76_01465 [Reichenbachiella sp. MSK19-1]SHK92783.1 hypothetical protein SAMN04488028_11220 [Reichenbachiella agariperforans]